MRDPAYLIIPFCGVLIACLFAFRAARWLKGLPEPRQTNTRPVVMSAFTAAICICFLSAAYFLWSTGKVMFPRMFEVLWISGFGFGVFWCVRSGILYSRLTAQKRK